jgi:sulfite exporter TauE/SafE
VNAGMYGTLLISGLLGSLGHCLGMCGPLMVMVGLQLRAKRQATLPAHLLYHGARIAVYAVLGAIIGGIGSLLGVGSGLSHAAGIASLMLGAGVILFGIGYLGWLPLGRLDAHTGWLDEAMGRAIGQGGLLGIVFLGALNGLLPCGLVYSALLMTATAGGPVPGAVGMFLFGVGTLPPLLVVGLGAGALRVRLRQALVRVAGAFIVVIGLQLVLRGLATFGAVPHLQWGGIVFW